MVEQLAPGLRRWTAWHEEWRQEVASIAVDTPAGLALIDPLHPPPEARRPALVFLTVHFHARSAGELDAKEVWAPARDLRLLRNRGVDVTNAFEAGDELPGGIQAFQTARETEVVYWLPDQRSLAIGDVLLGAGAKPHPTPDALRLCPESWLDGKTHKALRKSLEPLLELRVERILLSHGDSVLSGAKDALAELLG